MGERGREGQPTQNLRHTRPRRLSRHRGLAHAPVARRHAVLDALGDVVLLERRADVGLLAAVHAVLHRLLELLDQALEITLEEAEHERPGHVHALVGVVVAVVGRAPAQRAGEQAVAGVAQEELLLGQRLLRDADVRQQLADQDVLGVADAVLLGRGLVDGAAADVVQSRLACIKLLALRGLVERGAEGLHHLHVLQVVHDVLQHLAVALDAQSAEEDDDGDLLADVGQRHHHRLAEFSVVLAVPQLHVERRRRLVALLHLAAHLGHVGELADGLLEAKHEIIGASLLGEENLLTPVDDEVAALVLRAFLEINDLAVVLVV
mmetsp:Transcript_70577/g.188363  ORF Transcript_70577/g.188363 Transcript_70577/m.188363 type:complete len:321 (+) Transcript_70577:2166-3128(+)